MANMERISTPCVSFCWVDPDHGLCEGCGRTREELGRWTLISEPERRAIMAVLPARLRDARVRATVQQQASS